MADARDDNTPPATVTDADRAAAHALYSAWIEGDDCEHGEDDDMCTAIAQAIADAREEAFALCVEWVRDAEGDGVAADLVIAWRSR